MAENHNPQAGILPLNGDGLSACKRDGEDGPLMARTYLINTRPLSGHNCTDSCVSRKHHTVVHNVVRSGACHGHERKTNRAIRARKPQGRPDLCAPEQWKSRS